MTTEMVRAILSNEDVRSDGYYYTWGMVSNRAYIMRGREENSETIQGLADFEIIAECL